MKYIYVPLLFLSVLFAGLSCQRAEKSYPSAMQRAISLLSARPDSALYYLSQLDSQMADEPEETRMYHRLLTLAAEDKLYVPHTSDSLIREIVRYYEGYGDSDKLMMAYYYQGSVWRDMNDAPRAIDCYHRALEAGRHTRCSDLLISIYSQLGTLLAYQGVYDESLQATRTALALCRQYRDTLSSPFFLRNIGRIWDIRRNKDSVYHYYNAALQQARYNQDSVMIEAVLLELGAISLSFNEVDTAKMLLEKVKHRNDRKRFFHGILGRIYSREGQRDSARAYFNRALPYAGLRQQVTLHEELARLDYAEGRYAEAFSHASQSMALRDSVTSLTETEEVAKINALYNYHRTEEMNRQLEQRNRRQRGWLYGIVSAALLAACATAVWLRQKKHEAALQRQKIRNLEAEQYRRSEAYRAESRRQLAELEAQLCKAEKDKDTARRELLETRHALLELSAAKNRIEQQERGLLVSQLHRSSVYAFFHKAAHEEIRITAENWQELRAAIDAAYDDFTGRLYSLCPNLSEMELHICWLIKIQLSPKDMAQVVGRSQSAVSMARTRLYKKIHQKEGTTSDFDKFITDL
ncbi:hypothetical protein [uncultured Phocaeicola sp.]|uniref:hypothetical protein n=1 Tax=uncultured Phocaeicola sp. TaxID=990718 RepID=UPI0025E7D2E6|nr:hypothetical protein [uncultured Phocaeicola sp.]